MHRYREFGLVSEQDEILRRAFRDGFRRAGLSSAQFLDALAWYRDHARPDADEAQLADAFAQFAADHGWPAEKRDSALDLYRAIRDDGPAAVLQAPLPDEDRATLARADELLRWLGLAPHAHERCESFSRGMRQKVALAGALVHEPKLIILDEPLTGLDAASARLVKNVLTERVKAGNTVIMTTHILEIAERMADRIGVISSGRLIAEGTLQELRARIGTGDSSLEEIFLSIVEKDTAEA